MRYLNPKADLTFKKVFGEHPDLIISFLNALLPFDSPEEEIREIEYLPAELVPETPLKKNSIVDVRCRDHQGRQFIVEMQMLWSPAFMQRVLFNASKAYVRQLGDGMEYELLQPVYSLNLVNDIFIPELPDYYHDYRIVRMEHSEKVIEGLRFIFVELPKFTPQSYHEKRMQVLWLRYLTEINESTREVSSDLLSEPFIRKAVTQLEESAFTEAQLNGYDYFWDAVRVENTLINDARRKALVEGHEQGLAEGRKEGRKEGLLEGLLEGRQQGRTEVQRENAARMKSKGFPSEVIAEITGLSVDEVESILC